MEWALLSLTYMKAKTLKLNSKTITIIENEHKEVQVFEEEKVHIFSSFEQALKWAEKEVFNGVRNIWGHY